MSGKTPTALSRPCPAWLQQYGLPGLQRFYRLVH
jgi:hypothetical protein